MKLCTFEVRTHLGRQRRLGVVVEDGGEIVDLHFATAHSLENSRLAEALVPASLLGLLDGGSVSMEAARTALQNLSPEARIGSREETIRYRREEVRLLTPLPDARSLRDFFAFEKHVQMGFEKRGEPMPKEWYEMPVYYQTGHHNLIGTDQDVSWPSFTDRLDYELELAVIIGQKGRNIAAADARDYIAGYTILNDFSARDIQGREMKVRLGPAKGKHWCSGVGPWMVTADEIPDPYGLTMVARVNGEEWSRGNSSEMYWSFEQMIEFLSQDDTIYPGDILGSGTVGTGCGLELGRWVQPGDVIELEIEKIGVLRNRIRRPTK
ncbi:MAG TPA: fumarylacetoacetate hydrolase family protein [Acidobacteriaceae bacterium]|nr:fumarylacetoacetate hydrolase family protein [Acidobacteriaceae bacterium]